MSEMVEFVKNGGIRQEKNRGGIRPGPGGGCRPHDLPVAPRLGYPAGRSWPSPQESRRSRREQRAKERIAFAARAVNLKNRFCFVQKSSGLKRASSAPGFFALSCIPGSQSPFRKDAPRPNAGGRNRRAFHSSRGGAFLRGAHVSYSHLTLPTT